MKIFNLPILLSSSLILLVGCSQHHPPLALPTQQQQVEQLATLVAAGDYLRENCQRSDIPSQADLIQAAQAQAKLKAWPVDSGRGERVAARAQEIYNDLQNDTTPKKDKCLYFNKKMSAFIEAARKSH